MKTPKILRLSLLSAAAIGAGLAAQAAAADVFITEFMYRGLNDTPHEFIEFTNFGPTAVDFTGWRYDDDSASYAAGFSLSAFGLVNPGESVIATEMSADAFRAAWGLSADVKVIGNYTNNLGRADQINLFDGNGTLVDRLTFGDQAIPGTIRTDARTGSPSDFYALGANDISQWQLAQVGDDIGSYLSALGEIGNPGTTHLAPVPLPAAAWLLISGLFGMGAVRRKRAV